MSEHSEEREGGNLRRLNWRGTHERYTIGFADPTAVSDYTFDLYWGPNRRVAGLELRSVYGHDVRLSLFEHRLKGAHGKPLFAFYPNTGYGGSRLQRLRRWLEHKKLGLFERYISNPLDVWVNRLDEEVYVPFDDPGFEEEMFERMWRD